MFKIWTPTQVSKKAVKILVELSIGHPTEGMPRPYESCGVDCTVIQLNALVVQHVKAALGHHREQPVAAAVGAGGQVHVVARRPERSAAGSFVGLMCDSGLMFFPQ